MTSELAPEYLTKVAARKDMTHAAMPYLTSEQRNYSDGTVEAEILRVISGADDAERYARIRPDSVAFTTAKTGKIIAPGEFKKISRKMRFEELSGVLKHYSDHCAETPEEQKMKNLNHLHMGEEADPEYLYHLDIKGNERETVNHERRAEASRLAEQFIETVRKYLQEEGLTKDEPSLYLAAQLCTSELNNVKFRDFIETFQESSLFSHDSEFEYSLCSYINIINYNPEVFFKTGVCHKYLSWVM